METIIIDKITQKIKERTDNRTIFVGVHGPQGCGKSTSCENVRKKLSEQNIKCFVFSLDDFYYPHSKMQIVLILL